VALVYCFAILISSWLAIGEPAQLARYSMAALGGMERFVQPGDDVVVKPNICVAYHT